MLRYYGYPPVCKQGQEEINYFCYDKCPSGYYTSKTECIKYCDTGYINTSSSCKREKELKKRHTYSRLSTG